MRSNQQNIKEYRRKDSFYRKQQALKEDVWGIYFFYAVLGIAGFFIYDGA